MPGATVKFAADALTMMESTPDGYLATASVARADGSVVKLHTRQDSLLWEDDAAGKGSGR